MEPDRLVNNLIVEGLRRESPKGLAVLLGAPYGAIPHLLLGNQGE
jgi:hypothetical protein